MALADIFTTGAIIYIVLLALLFVIAYKILKIFLQIVLVSIFSAGVYIILYLIGFLEFSLLNLLFFSFIGTLLYLFYSALFYILSILFRFSKKISGMKIFRKRGFRPKGSKREKEVILKEVRKDGED